MSGPYPPNQYITNGYAHPDDIYDYRLSPEELHQKQKRRAQMEQQERDYRASMLQGMGMNNTARNDALHMQMRQDEALQKQIEYQAAKALAAKKKRAMLLLTTEN
jgi:predicted component of type VI protein secretion system